MLKFKSEILNFLLNFLKLRKLFIELNQLNIIKKIKQDYKKACKRYENFLKKKKKKTDNLRR